MDELVKNTAVVDGALVRAVTALMPGESIEKILDATREVNLRRVLNSVKVKGYETVIHLVDDLTADGLSEEDIRVLLTWIGQEDLDAKALVESGLVGSVFKFFSDLGEAPNNRAAWCCTRPKVR